MQLPESLLQRIQILRRNLLDVRAGPRIAIAFKTI
jgi:hypothetical protein